MYLYDAQCVVQFFADFLLLLLLLLLALRWVLVVIVNTEAKEDLHGAEAIVEVVETHLIEAWKGITQKIGTYGTSQQFGHTY